MGRSAGESDFLGPGQLPSSQLLWADGDDHSFSGRTGVALMEAKAFFQKLGHIISLAYKVGN